MVRLASQKQNFARLTLQRKPQSGISKEVGIKKKSADYLNDIAAQKYLNFIVQSSSERAIIGTELNDQIFPWNEGAQCK
jgi:hypothetical protein